MGTKTDSGFTIIEVIFFLAISGLLVIGVLSSVTLTVQRQRYTDSMRNFQSYVQQEFSRTLNIVNQRDGGKTCDAGGVNDDGSVRAGASDCVLLGKLFVFSGNESTVDVFNVVGVKPATEPSINTSEIDVIKSYNPRFSNIDENTEYRIPWGAQVVGTLRKTGQVSTDQSFNSLAILRSPRSGSTLTYAFTRSYPTSENRGVLIRNNLTTDTENKDLNICVDSQDLLTNTAALRISGQGSQDGVQTLFDINKSTECKVIQ